MEGCAAEKLARGGARIQIPRIFFADEPVPPSSQACITRVRQTHPKLARNNGHAVARRNAPTLPLVIRVCLKAEIGEN